MKIFTLVAAAAVAFIAAPSAASASVATSPAPAAALVSSVATSQSVRVSINDQRRHRRGNQWRRVCRTKWRHGRRIRTCTRVRVRNWNRHNRW